MFRFPRIALLGATGLLAAVAASAQSVSYLAAGSVYNQDFNGLPLSGSTAVATSVAVAINGQLGTTGMNGWHMLNDRGSSSSTEFRAQNGSLSGSAGRGVVSFGTTGDTDRALGALSTSNQISTFGVYLQNNTGQTLTSFDLGFVGEQWRAGESNIANSLTFKYKVVNNLAGASLGLNVAGFTEVSALKFNTPLLSGGEVPLNGNDVAYQTSLSATTNLNWQSGQVLVLQWSVNELQGQDNGLAIDNLTFSAIPEPSFYAAFLGLAAAGLAIRRRHGRSARKNLAV